MKMVKTVKCIITSLLIITLLFMSACTQPQEQISSIPDPVAQAADILKVTVLNLGKADAIVLMTENHAVLIDAGLDTSDTKILDFLSQNNISSLDYLILTHFDKDHIGAANAVIKNGSSVMLMGEPYC